MKYLRRSVIFIVILANSARANVLALFPAGAACKSAAIESAVDCNEPQTLLYNPSMLAEAQDGFTAELGLAKLSYSYEHPDFDPVRLNLVTPMFSEGWKGSLPFQQGSWGFAVMPGSMADLNLNGLPRRVMGNPESLNIKAKRRTFHIPLGASFDLGNSGSSLGASLVYTYDERVLKGAPVTNSSSQLVDLKARGNFFRPIIGAKILTSPTKLGVSYIFPLSKHYAGTTKIASEPQPFGTELTDYDPGMLLMGASQSIGKFSVSENLNYIFGSRGKTVARDGLNRKTSKADLKDVKQIGLKVAYIDTEFGKLSLGLAYLDSFWGDGYYYKDSSGFAHHEIGNVFGAFNAVPVRNQSVTWNRPLGNWDTHLAIFRSSGSTTVGSMGDNPGYYQLEFVSITCGIKRIL